MSETIWRATDLDGKCFQFLRHKPEWNGKEFGCGYGDGASAYKGTDKPPAGECWEMTVTRRGDIDTDGEPIGWKIVGIGKDGSVLCEKGNGQRRRYLFGDGAKDQPTGEAWERLAKELDELKAKLAKPEMPECVAKLLQTFQPVGQSLINAVQTVRDHYAPPFRIQGPGVYETEDGNPWEVIYIDPKGGVVARHETTKLLENFHVSGSCKGGNFSLTKFLRPLEG